ncbi:MAG: hypothetical protein KY459_07030 [Acidobacteria bacterium]|nr:hypothetical protein [Acidobacteriota bacterium]
MRASAALVLCLTLAVPAAAQESGSEDPETGEVAADESVAGEEAEGEDEEGTTGDYSREALSLIFLESEEDEDGPPEEPFTMRWQDWAIRWIPLMMPLELNDGSGGPTLNQWPDAMTLLGMDYPPAGAAGDEWSPQDLSWGERRWRWRMIRAANRANAAQNAN